MSNEAQISQLFQFIKQNKFHFESYLKLISICKEVGNDAELVRARQEFHNVFPIPLEEWREWIKGANSSEVSILYESALQECKSSELWADYLYYKIQNGSSPVEIRNQYSKAEREISSDYKSSSLVFNMFIDYELAFLESMHESSGMESDSESEEKEEKIEYEHEETAEKIEFCRSQFLTRLQTPHIDIEKTFEKYCMFESSFGGTKEEELKRNGSMLMTTTRNRSSIRDKLEYDLENLDYSLEAYHDYIYNEKKVFCKIQKSESDRRFVRESKNFIAGIYQRALLKFPYDSTLRKSLIIYLASIEYDKLYLIKQTELALKIFMTDIELWCYLLRFLKLDENGLKNAYLRGSKILNQSLSPFQSVSLLKATKLVVDESIHKDIEVVRRNYQKMKKELAQFSKSRNLKDDTDFNLERAMARFEFRNNNWSECTKILQECTKKLASVELFLEWITMANVQNPAICRDLYKKAMIKSTGNRELIYDSWIRYELINSSDDQLHIALGYIHSARERDLYRTVHDVQVVVHSSDSNKRKYHEAIAGSHKKQKPNPTNGKDYTNIAETSDSPMAPTKLIQKADAEKAVFVPLAEGMEKENLLRKASDFGEVNDYDVVDGGLYIEFKTIQAANRIVADRFAFGLEENVAVYKCLPRNWAFSNKECKDTVFVNHLPASSKKITLREAMVRFGKIIDIRLVSKPSHSFAYIQFEQEVVDLNQESATKSLALNNTSINGHSVSVAISDPTKKKVKTLDERELFVGNLPANVTEEVVRSHFARFGQVRIRTFRNTAFLHYSDKESAKSALEMNSQIIDGRVINVCIADPAKNKRGNVAELKPSFVPRQASLSQPSQRKPPKLNSAVRNSNNSLESPAPAEPKQLSQDDFRGNDASLFAKDKDLFSNASDYHGRLLLNFAHETYRGAGTRTFLPVLEKRMTVENLHNMPVQNENQQQKVHRIMEAKADARHTETKANTEVSASNTNVRVTPAVDQELTRTDLPLNTEITAEELISKGETVDSEDVQKMTLDDAEKLIAEGTEALTLKDFELAANKLSLALEIQVSKLGQYAEVAASTFYLYGKALFGLSVQNTSVLGDKAEKAEVEQNAVAAYSSDEDGDEEETALEDIAVPADDLELAWENLDVARIILSKNQDSTTQVRLADVHICLGDISLENENFDQAASDFQIALDIKLQHLANKYRELAEVYFKLAISLEYAENYESAIEHIFSAKESLNKRVAELQEGEDGDTERKQIFDFLQDMDVKVSDIKAILEKEAVQELGESSRSSMPVDVKVNDVSSLVKKQKRKAEINSNDEKKVKLE